MANTFSSALVVDTAAKAFITVLQPRLAALKAFSSDFSDDVIAGAGRRTLQATVVSSAAAAVTNPTSFNVTGSTMTNAPISMNHISAGFGLTSDELNKGFRLEKLMKANVRSLGNAIMDVALGVITTTKYGASAYSTAITKATGGTIGNSLITDALPSLFAALKDGTERHLVLDGSYYAYLLPQTGYSLNASSQGAYGFDGIHLNNRWTGVTSGSDTALNGTTKTIKGFAVSPEAIAVASGIPYIDPAIGQLLYLSETVVIEDLGLPVQLNVWGDPNTRSLYASFDILFGAAAADGSALKIINV